MAKTGFVSGAEFGNGLFVTSLDFHVFNTSGLVAMVCVLGFSSEHQALANPSSC